MNSKLPSLETIYEKLMFDSESEPLITIFKNAFTDWLFNNYETKSCATASRIRQKLEHEYGLSFEKEYVVTSNMMIARQINRETRNTY